MLRCQMFDALYRKTALLSLSYNAAKEVVMAENSTEVAGSTVIPAMRYREAHQAIDWLVKALGFTAQAVYDGPDGTVAHAQLTLGRRGMIMLGSATNKGGPENWVQPDEVGRRSTHSVYLVVGDATAAYGQAKAAGAEFTMELQEMEYGGKAFGCKDPEGHSWSVGEYDPWA